MVHFSSDCQRGQGEGMKYVELSSFNLLQGSETPSQRKRTRTLAGSFYCLCGGANYVLARILPSSSLTPTLALRDITLFCGLTSRSNALLALAL